MAANLFQKAKENGVKKVAEKHEVVSLDPSFETSLSRMNEIDQTLAALKSEREILDAEVREASKQKMIGLYNEKKSFPGTLKVLAGNMMLQFITMDKYIKIDQERASELSERYGNQIISEETVYSFNPDLLEKYSQVLSDLILNSKKIEEADKARLIESTTSIGITKGTVKNLRNEDYAKFNLSSVIEDIKPIFAIKSIQSVNEVK